MMYWRSSLLFALLAFMVVGCVETNEPFSQAEQDKLYGEVETTYVKEPVEYTNTPYDFVGPTSISDLINIIPASAFVWYGFSPEDRYPVTGGCDLRGNEVEVAPELPVEVEGIVTLHPRYFVKISFCGEDERYYGTYFIQDSSGSIMVLKDSRIADFVMGDRIRIKVRGLMKFFDQQAVLLSDPEQVVSEDNPIYYDEIDRPLTPADYGSVKRFTGKVSGLPDNQNFNEMCMVRVNDTSAEICAKTCRSDADCLSNDCVLPFASASTGTCSREGGYWLVSMDREIGQRQPRIIKKGDIIEVTGPIENSFGLKFLIARWGQLRFIEK